MTHVVAALIWDGNRFLACQRPANKARGLLWEFVGGKVEPGETKEDALIRECREELDVTVSVGEVFMSLTHEYPDLTVCLTLFNARIAEGTPKMLEHNDIRWITTSEIDDYDFCPADVEILHRLKQIDNGIQAQLHSLADPAYKAFQCSLMPTVSPDTVIGVRMPLLRNLASSIQKEGREAELFDALPHRYYEENNIHGILISQLHNYSETVTALNRFLPHVDNWATCDLLSPVSFRSCPEELIGQIRQWLSSSHPYTVRFGIGMLMKYYLGSHFTAAHLHWVAAIKSEEYYVNMMSAWYFATALAKQPEATLPILENNLLDPWVHNKTIQKATESFRIPTETKKYLKTLKR